jgi:hypothetical protein
MYNMNMPDELKNKLFALEKQLRDAYDEFKKVYAENYNNRQLTNEEVYQHIMDEDKIYNDRLKTIRQHTINIMKQIYEEHDQKAYNEILTKLHQ